MSACRVCGKCPCYEHERVTVSGGSALDDYVKARREYDRARYLEAISTPPMKPNDGLAYRDGCFMVLLRLGFFVVVLAALAGVVGGIVFLVNR